MKDDNYIRGNNAKHLWHPMGHPAASLEHPPTVITSAAQSSIIWMVIAQLMLWAVFGA